MPYRIAVYVAYGLVTGVLFLQLVRSVASDLYGHSPPAGPPKTPLACLEITFWDFRRAAKANPDITWKLLQYLVDLLVEERLARSQAFAQAL